MASPRWLLNFSRAMIESHLARGGVILNPRGEIEDRRRGSRKEGHHRTVSSSLSVQRRRIRRIGMKNLLHPLLISLDSSFSSSFFIIIISVRGTLSAAAVGGKRIRRRWRGKGEEVHRTKPSSLPPILPLLSLSPLSPSRPGRRLQSQCGGKREDDTMPTASVGRGGGRREGHSKREREGRKVFLFSHTAAASTLSPPPPPRSGELTQISSLSHQAWECLSQKGEFPQHILSFFLFYLDASCP